MENKDILNKKLIDEAINIGSSKINYYFYITRPSENAVMENIEDWSESTEVIVEKLKTQIGRIEKCESFSEEEGCNIAESYNAVREICELLFELIFGLAYRRALYQAKEKAVKIINTSDSKDIKEMLELVNSLGKEEIEFLKKVIEIKEWKLERKAVEE